MEPFDSPHASVRLGVNIALLLLGFLFVFGSGYWAYYKWAGPAYEDVRHETFEHSTAYIQGKVQALNRYRLDYETSSEAHRVAIARMARHEASTIDAKHLSADLQAWLLSLSQANKTK